MSGLEDLKLLDTPDPTPADLELPLRLLDVLDPGKVDLELPLKLLDVLPADLADMNFDRLGLLPLRPDHFGHIDQITYPIEPLPPITVPTEVMSRLGESE